MLHRIYERFRAGKLPKEDGQALKAMVLSYAELPHDEQRQLTDAFLLSWSEDLQAHRAAIKAVSALYLEHEKTVSSAANTRNGK